jgi:threonine dehydratase
LLNFPASGSYLSYLTWLDLTIDLIQLILLDDMADLSTCLPLTRESVQAAHEIVRPHVHLTPVLTSSTLNRMASTPQTSEALKGTEFEGREPAKPKINLFFKCENYQRIGAFKVRGAFHALSRLDKETLQKGIVTHSSGPHPLRLSNQANAFSKELQLIRYR